MRSQLAAGRRLIAKNTLADMPRAMRAIFPASPRRQLSLANEWLADPIVVQILARLRATAHISLALEFAMVSRFDSSIDILVTGNHLWERPR